MTVPNQELIGLKAELYDKDKVVQQLSSAISALAAVTATGTLQELYDKVAYLVAFEQEHAKQSAE